jgi:hypothetical protein
MGVRNTEKGEEMSQSKIRNATKPVKVRIVSAEEAEKLGETNRVPTYRVKTNQKPVLMGYCKRSAALQGAKEIRIGDEFTDIVFAQSDA